MTQLEAHLAAEVIAAQLLSEPLDTDKLGFLRERAEDLVIFLDEQLEGWAQAVLENE